MKYLVTGGRGFVGYYVCKKLKQEGHEVLILSNLSHPAKITDGMEYIYGDIRYQWDVEQAVRMVDRVIHLAARINVDRSRDHARPFFDVNVYGTFNVLEACKKYQKAMIHASTSEALGTMQIDKCGSNISTIEHGIEKRFLRGMNEEHPYSPDNPYGATKAAADMLCLGWYKSFDLDVRILRSFNITGTGQSYDKEGAFIPKVIERIICGKNPQIFGSGEQTRDYIYAGDVADAYCLVSEMGKAGEIYHVGTGREVSIKYIAEKLIDISGKNLCIEYLPSRPKEVKRLRCDSTKIRQLGWEPTKQIEDVLEEMYLYRLDKKIDERMAI